MPRRSKRPEDPLTGYRHGIVFLLAGLGILSASCSGDAASNSSADPNAGAFKSAEAERRQAGAGLNLLVGFPFAVPSDGFVLISATGNCSVVQALPVASVLEVEIETTLGDSTPHPGDATFLIGGGGSEPAQGSFAVTRVLPVSAGANVVYLVVDNPSNGGVLECSASLSAVFQSHQLE